MTEHTSIAVINALVLALGIINALDAPARHMLVAKVVGRELIPSAMALGETLMSVGVMLGSSAAGILIATIGIAPTFFVNAATFLAVIISLYLMDGQPTGVQEKRNQNPFRMFSSGVRYIIAERNIRSLLLLVGVTIFFGFPYRTLMPTIAKDIFGVGSIGFGWLSAAPGVGAFVGAMIFSRNTQNKKRLPLSRFIFLGYLLMGISLVTLSITSNFAVGMMEIALAATGLTFATAALPSILRRIADEKMLGRVISVDVAIFWGGLAMGNFIVGWFAQHLGLALTINGSGLVFLMLATLFLFSRIFKEF